MNKEKKEYSGIKTAGSGSTGGGPDFGRQVTRSHIESVHPGHVAKFGGQRRKNYPQKRNAPD